MPARDNERSRARREENQKDTPRTEDSLSEDWFSHALLRVLLHAYTWVDDGLQNYMRAHAAFSLPRAQSMLMVCIGDGIARQSEMAKVLKVSKQAVRQGIRELAEKGLVELAADPDNQRSKIVCFTEEGSTIRETARDGLAAVERELAQRIGRSRVALLHDLLETEWGQPPTFSEVEPS